MRRTVPVEALLTQRPPAPTARRSGAAWGASPRLMTRALLALITVIPAPSSSATQIRPPPETIAPGLPSTATSSITPLSGSILSTLPVRGFETQTEPAPIVTPETPLPTRSFEVTRSASGSTPERVPSVALVTQTVLGPTASRSGGSATAIGSETETLSPPPNSMMAITVSIATTASPESIQTRKAPAKRRRQRLSPTSPEGALPSRMVGFSGRSLRTWVTAGVAPWRSRAASISAPAVA